MRDKNEQRGERKDISGMGKEFTQHLADKAGEEGGELLLVWVIITPQFNHGSQISFLTEVVWACECVCVFVWMNE